MRCSAQKTRLIGNTGTESLGDIQLLEAGELGSEAALGGGVNDKDDLALVLGQRLVSALLCAQEEKSAKPVAKQDPSHPLRMWRGSSAQGVRAFSFTYCPWG